MFFFSVPKDFFLLAPPLPRTTFLLPSSKPRFFVSSTVHQSAKNVSEVDLESLRGVRLKFRLEAKLGLRCHFVFSHQDRFNIFSMFFRADTAIFSFGKNVTKTTVQPVVGGTSEVATVLGKHGPTRGGSHRRSRCFDNKWSHPEDIFFIKPWRESTAKSLYPWKKNGPSCGGSQQRGHCLGSR